MSKISVLAPELLYVKGKKINIDDYHLLIPFYDNATSLKCMLKCGRQLGKSVSLSVKQCIRAALKEHSNMLTVFPLAEQTKRFSQTYIDNMFRTSPVLKERIGKRSEFVYTMKLKQLTNFSEMYYSFIGDDPDRIRGIAVQDIFFDEVQDMNFDFLPEVEQCAGAYKETSRFCYTGTPKTKNNTIESQWLNSSQCEPYIRCSRCGFDNYCFIPEVYKMIKEPGLHCQKCQRKLPMEDVRNAKYTVGDPKMEGIFDGYHIPQIFTPGNLGERAWLKTYIDFTKYSEFKFATEVLGISFDSGGSPITLEKLRSLCDPNRKMRDHTPGEFSVKIMGVDWGYASANSLTVITIIGVTPDGKYRVIFAKKFHYIDRTEQWDEIVKFYKAFGCKALACDRGVGLADNFQLRKLVGPKSVFEYNYIGFSNNTLKYHPEKMFYTLNRNVSIGLLFIALNKDQILFPRYDDIQDYLKDILSIYEEVRVSTRGEQKYYDRNPNVPDDFLHALNFAVITAQLLTHGSILSSVVYD